MSDLLGFEWVSEHTGITAVQPFAVHSKLGTTRRTVVSGYTRDETYPFSLRPEPTIAAHLTFAFKHEIVHLEFLARLFDTLGPGIFENWMRDEPAGIYARRAGFFFEWITGKTLDVPDCAYGNYVDALDREKYLVATRANNVQHWRVRDNMPGSRAFCPIVVRSQSVQALEKYDCAKALHDLEVEFGADVLLRSAVWLTVKESRASFKIEKEEGKVERVRRFAAAMEQRCGQDGEPLSLEALIELQRDILGPATRYGLRRSPMFVGHTSAYIDVVDYFGPHWQHTLDLLDGLRTTLARTAGAASVLRAAIASFGFVFIHPMADGNGRISRFLVNDVLRRDGAVPAPFILPISATITDSTQERAGYDRALEHFSKPLVRTFSDRYSFGAEVECEDGIRSNFHFTAYDEALPVWRYPDLTYQAEYLGHVIQMTIESEMSKEAIFLRDMDRARQAVKNHLEGPNSDIDQIIRSIRENHWKLSNKLLKAFPMLADEAMANAVVNAVREALEGEAAHAAADDGEPSDSESET